MTTIKQKTQLLEWMRQGATVITPNNRLALQLQQDYLAASQTAWIEKPCCLSYQAYLQQAYQKITHLTPESSHPLLLTPQQLRYLWQQLLIEKNQGSINKGFINEVQESWMRCLLWEIDSHHPAFDLTMQTRQFQHWRQCLEQQLEALDAISDSQLVPWIIGQDVNIAPQSVIWVCFDDYSPQQRSLQQHLEAQGTQHHHIDFIDSLAAPSVYAAKDEQDELQQLKRWLVAKLAEGKQRIAVIVPDLQIRAKPLQRYLQQYFVAETFNISMGQTLADYPLIAHALCWLNLAPKQLTQHQANLLLTSPFLGDSQSEMLARAQFLQDSPVLLELLIDFSVFTAELKKTAPLLAERLQALNPYPASASPQEWAKLFQKKIAGLGFPGEYPLDSPTYQCYQRFLLLLDEFKQLQVVCAEMAMEQALSAVTNLAKATIFQPKKKSASPVQIMGLLESGGLAFDCLWVTGLTDQYLPQKTRLSAFIPIPLQREKQMPYAHPGREWLLAQKTLTRLKHASAESVFSYPSLSQDKPNLPSPLLTAMPAHTMLPDEAGPVESCSLVHFVEHYQVPLLETETIGGGTTLLANQAKCPFRAFAAHRLHAKTSQPYSDGPNALERGQIIHKVLENLWRSLNDQQTLLAMDHYQLDQCIEKAINQALKPLALLRPYSFSSLIQDVEMKRLKRLVLALLEWEKRRPSFTVEALEQSFSFHLAGLDFKLRVDRLDKLASEKKWVIDYKSSMPQSMPWDEERPMEPQLLLYALLDNQINTLLFAELKNGQFQSKGFSETQQELPGIKTISDDASWDAYRSQWQNQLEALALDFQSGGCEPKPVKTSICQSCDFQNLCRFNPGGH